MAEKKLSKTISEVKTEKVPEVKAAVKETVEKVTAAAETTAKKAETAVEKKTATVKKAVKKTTKTAKKEESKTEVILEFQGNSSSATEIEKKIKDKFVAEGHRAGCIKTLNIYIKPEDYKAYYVINDKFSGDVDLF